MAKADVRLTLRPPGTPPVHHAARPGWIPGPGSFHCGTAGGRSHRAAKAEDNVTVLTCTASSSSTQNEFSPFNQGRLSLSQYVRG